MKSLWKDTGDKFKRGRRWGKSWVGALAEYSDKHPNIFRVSAASPGWGLTFLNADAPGAARWFWKSAPVRVNLGISECRLMTAQHSRQVRLSGCRGMHSQASSMTLPPHYLPAVSQFQKIWNAPANESDINCIHMVGGDKKKKKKIKL